MQSLVQQTLGADWEQLPPALQAHYRFGAATATGLLDVSYPRFMQPLLNVLRVFGILINRRGQNIQTTVEKRMLDQRQIWQRTLTCPDGKAVRFNSFWIHAGPGQIIEFVNPVLGLQMSLRVADGQLHYHGMRFIVKLGPLRLPIPQWLLLGRATIVEQAIDARHFVMDFRLTHPLLGETFRYSGTFTSAAEAPAAAACGA